ncbi:MAG: lysophospholipid acyltransferase family protein [Planctomycetota bacterium]
MLHVFFHGFYRLHVQGVERVPASGACLLAANHVSFFDPPLVGTPIKSRGTHFLARASLFKGPLGWLITRLNTIPLEDQSGDIRAIRTVIERLGLGQAVVVFPEGSRSWDGAMQPCRDGVRMIVRRAKCPVVPVAIEGAFDAWPRTRKLPRLFGCRIAVSYGEPIEHGLIEGEGGTDLLAQAIDAQRLELRKVLRSRTGGVYPPASAGDRSYLSGAGDRPA